MQELDLFGDPVEKNELLRDAFIEPPFSVLDARGGTWNARKRKWKALGIQSEVSREDVTTYKAFDAAKYGRKEMTEVSIFDPALTELLYRWFTSEGDRILDPFAGGSVRGIIANYLNRKYTGIDIRKVQIDSNREQAIDILPVNNQPQWYVGDSLQVLNTPFEHKFDALFSCPPYADLEVYSDLEGDISNMEYVAFMEAYTAIIKKATAHMKPGATAFWVISDIRDKQGNYRDFTGDTIYAFREAGWNLYNRAILLQPLGTAMLRAAKIFKAGKKLTKVHEEVLTFKL